MTSGAGIGGEAGPAAETSRAPARDAGVTGNGCYSWPLPELPEVEAVRRELELVMARARFDRVVIRRPDLRGPFPTHFTTRLTGETVTALTRRAKYLLGLSPPAKRC